MFESPGERELQQKYGSKQRADRFYSKQLRDDLCPKMKQLIDKQEMMFVSTADGQGNCDCTPRFGPAGFVRILDDKTLAYPEFRGNGVYASLGNLVENPHIGLLFIDFFDSTVGLHVNGAARICTNEDSAKLLRPLPAHELESSLAERWVIIDIHEAYIHCSKHVPKLSKLAKGISWGTDSPEEKSEGFFIE